MTENPGGQVLKNGTMFLQHREERVDMPWMSDPPLCALHECCIVGSACRDGPIRGNLSTGGEANGVQLTNGCSQSSIQSMCLLVPFPRDDRPLPSGQESRHQILPGPETKRPIDRNHLKGLNAAVTPRQRQPSKHGCSLSSDARHKGRKFAQMTFLNVIEPGIKKLACPLSYHLHEGRHQLISGFYAWVC